METKTLYDHSIQQSFPKTIHQQFKATHPELGQIIFNKNRRYCDCGHRELHLKAFALRTGNRSLHSQSEAAGAKLLPRKAIIQMARPAFKINDNGVSTAPPTIIKRGLQRLSLVESPMTDVENNSHPSLLT